MRGFIILQGDEEGKKIFMNSLGKKNKGIIFDQSLFDKNEDFIVEDYITCEYFESDYFLIVTGADCETIKYLQDYYPFYIVKVESCMCNKIENNFSARDSKFLLGCKSKRFESDMNEVLRLISI